MGIEQTVKTVILYASDLVLAADLLKNDEVVAFPTETVYGLGARVFSERGIKKIFSIKKRPADNPLIAHLSCLEQLDTLTYELPKIFHLLYSHFCPGPLTFILRGLPHVPSSVNAGLNTVAIRFPAHPIAKRLIELVGEPLVAPSANLSGKPSSTKLEHVLNDFDGQIPAGIDGGNCSIGIESTVISLLDPEHPSILRPGSITSNDLELVLGKEVPLWKQTSKLTSVPSPGLKYRHYAPIAPIRLVYEQGLIESYARESGHNILFLLPTGVVFKHERAFHYFNAQNLYDLLRQSDQKKYDEIIVFCDEKTKSNDALMNRLEKAAGA